MPAKLKKPAVKGTPFSRLGLPEMATPAEVRQTYRDLARKHHPDAGGERSAWDQFQQDYLAAIEISEKAPCPVCHGFGKQTLSTGFASIQIACPPCGGTGLLKHYTPGGQ